jgi:uncharacterized membrane protein YesL
MAAMAAFRTLWAAMVGLYDETLVLLAGNVSAVALNLPIGLLLLAIGLIIAPGGDAPTLQWLIALIAWLVVFLPTPGNVALAGLTRVAAGPDVPRFNDFRQSLARHWRLSATCSLVSVVILAVLVWNVTFYFGFGPGWPLFVTIFWLYASLFWLSLHIYLVPLSVHVTDVRLVDLYRRAAFIALGHAPYTFVLLVALLVVAFAAVVFLPVYVLVAPAFVSLAQAHALREIRRRHGDLPADQEEEVSRL